MLIIKLDPRKRLRMARAVVFSLTAKDLANLAEELHRSVIGGPPLFGPGDDLNRWADEASENDLVRCMKKCFNRLSSSRRKRGLERRLS